MREETIEFNTSNGPTSAYVVIPDDTSAPAVMLIHEWWGLAKHIKDIASRYAEEGFICIAPDLYRGKKTSDPDEASRLMHELAIGDGVDTIRAAREKATEKYGIENIGITGFCMGGTFALRAACDLDGFKASVPFYGDIPEEPVLQGLKTPVLFISGTKDEWINTEKVSELESIAARHTLPVYTLRYNADHAFFNDTRTEVYDEEAASDAWEKTLAFFREHLGQSGRSAAG